VIDMEKHVASRYVLYYVSGDLPDGATWSVYREQYMTPDDDDPIDGTQEYVSTHPNEAAARAEADRLQKEEVV
jgi:hypothetical protein